MRAITALSIASDAIRAAVIADPYTDSPTIKHFQALPLPVGAVVDGEVVDAEVVTGLLKTLVQRFKFPRENTILVYSSRRMVFREADFPYMSLADLRSTLPFQAKGMIPLPIEESELDFVPLSVVDDEQNGKQLHGILVATLRGGLEKTAYTAEEAGFVITSIDAGPFALARLFSDTNQAQTEAVVNINGNCTDVIVLNNGKPAYMRVVPSGADDVSDAIANALSISFEDAERIKNQIGLQNVTGDERLEKAEEVIRETTAQLIVGIRNTLNMYDVDHADSTISGIILTGTGARLIGLPPVLASSINKMVRIGDPFIRFKLSKEVERQNIVAHARGRFRRGAGTGHRKEAEVSVIMKLDMKSKKNKANSHRGRGKEIAYPDTSDGQKGTLLSMNVSDISNALKAGGIGKRSTAPENPADWTMRANLIPRSIVGLNRDRAIKYLLTYVLIGVLIVSLVVSVFMFAQSTWADHRVEVAQQKTISLQKEKAQFKDVEDTLNSLDDAQKAKIAMLYDEMDWMKVADSLNSSLPEGGQYTNLELKSFQIASSNNSSSSSDNTSTVWSGNGVISADFTIESPNFYSAKDFINNFASIPTYKTGYVSSITKNDSEGGTTYTYTGTISLVMDGNTTSRSDNSAGATQANRDLLAKLRASLDKAASGQSDASANQSTDTSSDASGSSN